MRRQRIEQKLLLEKKSIYDCIDDALDVVEESFEEPFFVIKMSKIYDGLKDKDEKAVAVGVVEVVKAMLTGKMQKKSITNVYDNIKRTFV